MVHPGPGLCVRLLSILSYRGSESHMKRPQWLFGFAVTLQSRKRDVYCEITPLEMQRDLAGSRQGWERFVLVVQGQTLSLAL